VITAVTGLEVRIGLRSTKSRNSLFQYPFRFAVIRKPSYWSRFYADFLPMFDRPNSKWCIEP